MTVPSTAPRQDQFSARIEDGFAVASLAGELAAARAPVLREQFLGLLRSGARMLVIDLSGVSSCDAAGLAVLLGADRRARALGGVLRLATPAPAVISALRSSGLSHQFDIFPTVTAAMPPPLISRAPDVLPAQPGREADGTRLARAVVPGTSPNGRRHQVR